MPRKPRTKKIITEQVVDVDQEIYEQQLREEPEVISPDDQLLDNILGQYGGQSGIKLKLQRVMASGQAEYLQTYPNASAQVAEVDEAFVQRNFGGGRYTFRFYRDGQLVHVYTVSIAADPSANPINVTNGRPAADPMMQMLLDDRKMMMEALFQNRQQTTPVGELAQAVSVITANRQAEPSMGEKMIDIFMKGWEMRSRTESGEPSEGGWLGFAKDMGKQLAPALLPALSGMLGGGQPNPSGGVAVPAPPGVPPEAIRALQSGIAYLKKKALAGKDPAFFVDIVMESRDEEMFANLVGLVCSTDFASIAALDPQIGQEPYHAFFVGIYNGIRQAVMEEQQEQQQDAAAVVDPSLLEMEADLGIQNGVKANGQAQQSPHVDTVRPGGDAGNPPRDGGASPRRRK